MTDHLNLMVYGYAETAAPATATVVRYDRRARVARAGRTLAVCWAFALAAVFVPVAHFVLVPGLVIVGLVMVPIRLQQREEVRDVAGTCPDCGAAQRFDVPMRWTLPAAVSCQECGRGLTLRD